MNPPTSVDAAASPALGLAEALEQHRAGVDREIAALLTHRGGDSMALIEAMRHATLGGGKRVRPFLVATAGRLFGAPEAGLLQVGAAIELLHSYSLVHDDLPCMDNDAWRRGQPTVHVKFGEAMAVLAGDALLTLAFEVLGGPKIAADPQIRLDLICGLARAAGCDGMALGQMMDLAMEGKVKAAGADAGLLASVLAMQRRKTGALIAFSAEAGAIVAGAPVDARAALRRYGEDLGLAFQIADDLLDVTGSEAELGKTVGKDAAAGKATLVALLGIEAAEVRARDLIEAAKAQLRGFGHGADALRALADFVISRRV